MPRERTALVEGFSLDANPVAEAEDRAGLERLIRYGTRPAFAQSRLSLTAAAPVAPYASFGCASGKVSDKLKRPWFTGQTHVVLAPAAFLRRLVALIPPPRQNTIRYHGCFAPHAKARPGIIALVPRLPGCATVEASSVTLPRLPGGATVEVSSATCAADAAADVAPPNHDKAEHLARTTRHSWAQQYRRVFAEDLLVCTRCGGPRRLIAFLSETNIVPLRAILQHLGLPTEPPRAAQARASSQSDLWANGV